MAETAHCHLSLPLTLRSRSVRVTDASHRLQRADHAPEFLRADASIKRDLHPQGDIIFKMSIASALNKSGRAIKLFAVAARSLRPILVADIRTFNGPVKSNQLRKMPRCPCISYRNPPSVVPDSEAFRIDAIAYDEYLCLRGHEPVARPTCEGRRCQRLPRDSSRRTSRSIARSRRNWRSSNDAAGAVGLVLASFAK